MPSQRKLNTYSVESPCNHLPRVGSFLANPELSKEQHLRRCIVTTFTMIDAHVGILAQHWRPYVIKRFMVIDIFIEIWAQHLRRCMVAIFVMIHESIGTLVKNKHHYALKTFGMPNTFIGKPFLYLWHWRPTSFTLANNILFMMIRHATYYWCNTYTLRNNQRLIMLCFQGDGKPH